MRCLWLILSINMIASGVFVVNAGCAHERLWNSFKRAALGNHAEQLNREQAKVQLTVHWKQLPDDEGDPKPMVLCIHRDGEVTRPLRVQLKLSGTMIPDIDYRRPPTWLEFPVGTAEIDVYIYLIDDDEAEGEETLIVEVAEAG